MKQCKCGSYAINQNAHGRMPGVDLDLCDVCYWRTRAEAAQARIAADKHSEQTDKGGNAYILHALRDCERST